MKRVIAVVVMSLLLLLAACESKTTGKRVAIPETSAKTGLTGGTTADIPPPTGETGKTAAEMLQELQTTGTTPIDSGVKSGTFYPPVTSGATGKEALAEKTDALMRQGTAPTGVQADQDFGPKYHDSDGDATNLPDNYDDNEGD